MVGREQIQHALAADALHKIVELDGRLAEEKVAALFVDLEQTALDRTDRRRRDIAVLQRQFGRTFADELHQRLQILEIDQHQAVVVGKLERDRQHAFLRVIKLQKPRRSAAGPFPRRSPAADGPVYQKHPKPSPESPRTPA